MGFIYLLIWCSTAVLDGHPRICGDYLVAKRDSKVIFSWSDECYTLMQNPFYHNIFRKLTWRVSIDLGLNEPIAGASFVKINESLGWRLGGVDLDNGIPIRDSTEFVNSGFLTDNTPGPDLPSKNTGFSSVKINETTVMIVGGFGEMKS